MSVTVPSLDPCDLQSDEYKMWLSLCASLHGKLSLAHYQREDVIQTSSQAGEVLLNLARVLFQHCISPVFTLPFVYSSAVLSCLYCPAHSYTVSHLPGPYAHVPHLCRKLL